MDYKAEILKMLEKIENERFFEFLYNLINSFKKEWGF